MAATAKIAQAIKDKGADDLLAVKANQPPLRAEIESLFAAVDQTGRDDGLDHDKGHDKGHGRVERRAVSVVRDVDSLNGDRRFPGELRLPQAATTIRALAR